MSFVKLIAASVAIAGALVASPAVQAHATYNVGATGANPVWANGAPAEWLPSDATVPSIGYLGIHSITNKRVIQTGSYVAPNSITTAQLGGVFGGATPVTGDTLLGQVYKYNQNPANAGNQLPTNVDISVAANSWNTGTGLSYGNIHASSGTGNPEANLIKAGVNFLNITVGDDLSDYDPNYGKSKLAFSIYQGWATGPGMAGLNLLGSVLANKPGEDIGISVALSGLSFNGAGTEGQYTIVVGDQRDVGGRYRMAIAAGSAALYSNVVAAVPVPGAVWLFGTAIAGFIGFGRRKHLAA